MRLTPRQVELLTDIATHPHMYVGTWGRWGKTATALARRGLATTDYLEGRQSEVTITEDGKAEAIRRGILPAGKVETAS
jgi:hypothetical protein